MNPRIVSMKTLLMHSNHFIWYDILNGQYCKSMIYNTLIRSLDDVTVILSHDH